MLNPVTGCHTILRGSLRIRPLLLHMIKILYFASLAESQAESVLTALTTNVDDLIVATERGEPCASAFSKTTVF